MDFQSFFEKATGFPPFPFQVRFACSDKPVSLLNVPTGAGKTATIILSWLWSRQFQNTKRYPRRLVYCLPMRTLVEQTYEVVHNWLKKLELDQGVSVFLMMGGNLNSEWDLMPEQELIIIGTQDQLLSRSLNRGYTMSRYRWPLHFGLLNNESLWVYDEIQLMGVGLATSCQMQAFRDREGVYGKTPSIWVSATMQKNWLETVDFKSTAERLELFETTENDREQPVLARRLNARKEVIKADLILSKSTKKTYETQLAELISKEHKFGHLTLVILNTVERARNVYEKLLKKKAEPLLLLHSQFRFHERKEIQKKIIEFSGILVSTQAIEAGVDISSKVLITELATWSALVQRFGRNNRTGEYSPENPSRIIWIDVDSDNAAPYDHQDLDLARSHMENLENAAPNQLPHVDQEYRYNNLIRESDLHDLFDTTPDIAGNDIDISRFIREGDQNDVQVYWRDYDLRTRLEELVETGPHRDELCTVSIGSFKKFVDNAVKKEGSRILKWDTLDSEWKRVSNSYGIIPGQIFLLHQTAGGYDPQLGWNSKSKQTLAIPMEGDLKEEANDSDELSKFSHWQSIREHVDDCLEEFSQIRPTLNLDEDASEILKKGIDFHDIGKTHPVFQEAMNGDPPDQSILYAKAPSFKRYCRKGFRHELASALAVLKAQLGDKDDEMKNNLIAYLAAAHHGKVRCSIRSLPIEKPPRENPETRFARGIIEGDVIINDLTGEEIRLSLEYMDLGEGETTGPSWMERVLDLRDTYGIFKLAYLEALIKAIDERGSRRGVNHGK